jgi:hypothetical protein
MIAVTLTAVAAAGATAVYYAGEAQHRRDRADISRWEARALPAAQDAAAIQRTLRASLTGPEIARLRARLRADAASITASPLPDVVKPAAAAYLDAIRKTEASLGAAGIAFQGAQNIARAAFVAADAAVQTLVCRARLPACSNP